VPGVQRQPLKKLGTDGNELLKLLERWRTQGEKVGHKITRLAIAFEAGRDGFWLARRLRAPGIDAHVIHASSVAVSREHRRTKTDRLDTELLKRAFIGWLRGKRKSLVGEQSRIVNRMKAALTRLGIRSFNPKLKKAADCLKDLRTPEGKQIPSNTLGELLRDMERRRLIVKQIRQIEVVRLERLMQGPMLVPMLWFCT
jgi:transposase